MLHCPVECLLWDTVRSHHVLKRYYIAPHGQWAAGCFHCVRREYRLGGRPDTGGPVRMESSGSGVQFQPRDGDG